MSKFIILLNCTKKMLTTVQSGTFLLLAVGHEHASVAVSALHEVLSFEIQLTDVHRASQISAGSKLKRWGLRTMLYFNNLTRLYSLFRPY